MTWEKSWCDNSELKKVQTLNNFKVFSFVLSSVLFTVKEYEGRGFESRRLLVFFLFNLSENNLPLQ